MTLQITSKAIDHSLVRIFGHSTLNKPHTADNISCVSRSCNEEKKKKGKDFCHLNCASAFCVVPKNSTFFLATKR